ncbi:hypothetical protein C5L31_000677 [Secundilactobacillus malefermentans]|uniref:Uncharacterized protein n=1 Tax=Secundilactobacillus malefermentans TaxID=176292 RepID=A0A4V3A3V2_9LACO|nr:PAS domain-containing protein [Secundilactobacillus malefermentans]KRM57314.1 flavoprotein [Secundilactobacillus malefermentans DSM 5705 = KCTC 3548]TDG77241.1 hypothetical protein C5L31_000677 [Secundilactobacillus malefermentans]
MSENDFSHIELDNGNVEDLTASGKSKATVEGVDMNADDWVEQAAKKVNAAEGKDYVKLDRGILTVDQLNNFLNSMPMELTYADDNNQFIYYNNMVPHDDMLAPRWPKQAGDPMSAVHPARAVKHVAQVINGLRTGEKASFQMPVPGNGPDRYIIHNYIGMHDKDGDYAGVNEQVLDIMPEIKWYLAKTGQKLVPDPDAVTGASVKGGPADTATAASGAEPEPAAKPDTSTGASDAAPAPKPEPKPEPKPDTSTGASEG